jgi:membrane protein DedA with SNARE-associated domain
MGLAQLLDLIKTWAEGVITQMGYFGLSLVMFLENVFPPIPSEVVLPLAGNLTNTGEFSMFGVVFWGMIGSLLGAYLFYGLGILFNEDKIRCFVEKYGKWAMITVEDFDKAIEFFDKYGPFTIFFGRMVPIVRSLISIPAGMHRMKIIPFTLYTIVGTSLWNVVLAVAGKLLGPQWPKVIEWIDVYQNIVIVLILILVVWFAFTRIKRIIQQNKK